MPTGIYKRKKSVKSVRKYKIVKHDIHFTTTAALDSIIELVKSIKKNKIGRVR